MTPPPTNRLPNIDYSGHAWSEIQRWAEGELQRARERNDSLDLSIERTAALRGEIAVLRRILGLPAEVARSNGVEPG